MLEVDDRLGDWREIRASAEWPTLLIGNGVSMNLWSGFGYRRLFDEVNLSIEAREIFDALDTTNFESVLECLHHAHIVLKALGSDLAQVDALYKDVRDALFSAVVKVHVPWIRFPQVSHTVIAKELDGYRSVFTTNYDLSLYWSQMQAEEPVAIGDFFWNGYSFDPKDTGVAFGRTAVYYLHGAIHLWQDDLNRNGKWTSVDGDTLLDLGSKYQPGGRYAPLFVSEGTSEAKLGTIRKSPYLSFCRDSLEKDQGNTIVLGSALAENDSHISEALNSGRKRKFAIAIHRNGDSRRIISQKVHYLKLLGEHYVEFFDSATHPLADRSLRISESLE